jgi:hypothetical protein
VASAEFWTVANLLGHDQSALRAGREECTYFTVGSLLAARRVLSRATDDQQAARRPTFFQRNVLLRRALGQGQHDRGEAVVFAGAAPSDQDERGLRRHLPIHVKAVSVATKRVPSGHAWDLTVRGERWGLDDLEELYVVANVGTLVLEPGAAVLIRGNVFSLLAQQLVCTTPSDAGIPYHIGILATPFSVDQRRGPDEGTAGRSGPDGVAGADGRPAAIRPSILGPVLAEQDRDPVAGDGGPGQDGGPAAPGGAGRNGGMCKLAELTFRAVDGPLTLYAQAGRGGDGGGGGAGGAGGAGGRGTDGARTLTATVPPGTGGSGGRGGRGGDGGAGGHGGIASNIYLTVPADRVPEIRYLALPSLPGAGGAPGLGGPGGPAGAGGAGGAAGVPGPDGATGKAGRPGRARDAPVIFVNDRAATTPTPTQRREIA